ncbi:hypothetical protein [Lysobacter gummosus]
MKWGMGMAGSGSGRARNSREYARGSAQWKPDAIGQGGPWRIVACRRWKT